MILSQHSVGRQIGQRSPRRGLAPFVRQTGTLRHPTAPCVGKRGLGDSFGRGSGHAGMIKIFDTQLHQRIQFLSPLWESSGVVIGRGNLTINVLSFDLQLYQLKHHQPLLRFGQIGNERFDASCGILSQQLLETIAHCVELMQLGNRQVVPISIEFHQCVFRVLMALLRHQSR